jgi:hypothetical protein
MRDFADFRTVGELLDGALSLARHHADELDCTDQLEATAQLLERGGGAGGQRAVHDIPGMDAPCAS